MATHSSIGEGNGNPLTSILAWRIPGTEEPGGLLSMGLHLAAAAALQYSCLGNLMDRGAYYVTFPGVARSQT